jgi:hypothetical protein
MPFASEKQRKFMWAKHPRIAKRWAHESKRRRSGTRRTTSRRRRR